MPLASNSPRVGTLRDTGEGSEPLALASSNVVAVSEGSQSEPISPTLSTKSSKRELREQLESQVLVGMRSSITVQHHHMGEKIGFESEEDQGNEVVMRAILEHSREETKGWYATTVLGIKKSIFLAKKNHKELAHSGHVGERRHPAMWARNIVVHPLFETAMAVLIVSNCMVIGWQAELRHPEGATKLLNTIFEHVFTFLFSLELFLRALVFNWTFWLDKENRLDIFLVCLSVLNSWILKPIGVEADFMRKASVLRILRLIRIAKNFRQRCKEMWKLIRGLNDSLETLVWTYLMMFCVLYFFAISATTIFTKMGAFDSDEEVKAIAEDNFGDVIVSMLTLFQIMTLDSWTSIARPLMEVQTWSIFFFILFITISVFLVMNLITSVIVTETFKHGREDKIELAAEVEAAKEVAIKELMGIFQEMDEDGGGTLSREEVAKAWRNRKVRQKFRTMDINKEDLIILWTALDDGDGELTIEEFIQGMRKLKGEAKAKDILKLNREVSILLLSIKELTDLADYSNARMGNIKMKLRTTFRELDATRRTLSRVKETAKLAAKTQALSV